MALDEFRHRDSTEALSASGVGAAPSAARDILVGQGVGVTRRHVIAGSASPRRPATVRTL